LTISVDSVSLQLLKGSKIQHSDFSYEYDEIFHEPTEFYKYKNLSKLKEDIQSIKEYVSNDPFERKVYMHPKFEDMSIVDFDQDSFFDKLNSKTTRGFKKCKYPWSSAHINADGDVFPCLSISFGNVKNHNLVNIFDSDKAKLFRDRIYNYGNVPACARCGWLKCN
jgi:MoaA/NifB/PqqE/SkfB family radical SAM enzyme